MAVCGEGAQVMDENNFEPKYRKFRWVLNVPDLAPWVLRKIEMGPHLWTVSFVYIEGMEVGICPVQQSSHGKLELVDEHGSVVRTCNFNFHLMDYVPITDLDYIDSEFVTGAVIIDVTHQDWN